jgi:hypothetical protein
MENKNIKTSSSIPADTQVRPNANSFNAGWTLMKGMVMFFGFAMLLVVVAAFLFSYTSNQSSLDRAYIITDAGTLVASYASSSDLKSRKVELENHVTMFFNKMYSFNEYTFKDNVEDALHLIGTDGKRILTGYNSANAYETLVKTSASVSVSVDSIWTDMESNPYRVKAFVRQFFSTPAGTITKKLYSDMIVRDLGSGSRSDDNIHGLLIDNFNVFDGNVIDQTTSDSEN